MACIHSDFGSNPNPSTKIKSGCSEAVTRCARDAEIGGSIPPTPTTAPEGAAKRLATGPETQGCLRACGSTPPPSSIPNRCTFCNSSLPRSDTFVPIHRQPAEAGDVAPCQTHRLQLLRVHGPARLTSLHTIPNRTIVVLFLLQQKCKKLLTSSPM